MNRPTALPLDIDGIPDALTCERRWVLWRYEWQQHDGKKGRWTKILCTVRGRHAKSNDPATWTAFGDVIATYDVGGFDGIGFCLGDGWAGIDLDHCRTLGGRPIDRACATLDRLMCYVDISPSGTGYKAIGRATRIGGQIDFAINPPSYTTWQGPRFFAITGLHDAYGDPNAGLSTLIEAWFPLRSAANVLPPVPAFIRAGDTRGTEQIGVADVFANLTDEQVLECILRTSQAEKFIRLVRGDLSDYGGDHSRADQALCSLLAYWCQRDVDQIDRLFRQTALMRDKWNTTSYRRATLAKAVQR